MNEFDRLRARLVERSLQVPEPKPRRDVVTTVLVTSLALGFLAVVAITLI